MVALPDYEREFPVPPYSDSADASATDDAGPALLRGLMRLLGGALIGAALGLWLLPSVVADPAMMLMKLLFSLGLFWAGLLALHNARRPDTRPVIQIDRRNAQLRILHPGRNGVPARCVVHRFDALSELSLRDGLLSARDGAGRLIVSLEVSDTRAERHLRQALSLAA
ncbi:MAG: hypothetical protein CVT70_15760 [Alphaproteobacteria bacterium HGW-Alphaproteobacteria-1]|jgi:hypothetical protein|nr:MAG: hypothetical protein CVT70_15760 [Alphaproteobacteria bacterium HGW-Alphaproteobacteria-1]